MAEDFKHRHSVFTEEGEILITAHHNKICTYETTRLLSTVKMQPQCQFPTEFHIPGNGPIPCFVVVVVL